MRKIIQIVDSDGTLIGLADDGTVWCQRCIPGASAYPFMEWVQLPSLPQPEVS